MTKKSRILYIDDDQDIVYVQKRILERYGYDADMFVDPVQALDHFRLHPRRYDIAIVDLVMPSMNGNQLACELKKLNPAIPVVLCTGFGSEMADKQVRDLGLDGFLIKPIAPHAMLKTLSRLIPSSR